MYTQPFLLDLKGHSVFLQILVCSDYFHPRWSAVPVENCHFSYTFRSYCVASQ